MLLINLKTYPLPLKKGKQIILSCERAANRDITVVLAVPALDLEWYAAHSSLPIYAQHVDPFARGAHSGAVLIPDVVLLGGRGSLLNHSEKRVEGSVLKATILMATIEKFPLVVCARNCAEVRRVSLLKPAFVAVEPPELIGGKVSVSSANPGLISSSVHAAGTVPVLVGAGVHTAEDVRVALSLGACGVLVASGVVLARDPGKVIKELVKGFGN